MNKSTLLRYLNEQLQYHTEEAEKFAKGNNYNTTHDRHIVAANVYKKIIQDIECGEFDYNE